MVIDSSFAYNAFRTMAKIEPSAGGGVSGDISSLNAGDIVDAEVVSDLGEGRYTVDVKVQAETEKVVRLNIKTEIPLEKGDQLKMEVKQSGAETSLDIISAPSHKGSSIENAATLSINQRGNAEIAIPVSSLPENLNIQQLNQGEIISLEIDPNGEMVARLSDGSALKPEESIIDRNLLNLIQKAALEKGIDLNISTSSIRQKVVISSSIEFETPEGMKQQVIQIGSEIRIAVGDENLLTQNILSADQNINAEIVKSKLGEVVVNANGKEITLNVSDKVKLPSGSDVVLMPKNAFLMVEGKVHANLPEVLKLAGLASDSPAQAALDNMITEAGLSANIQTRQAATSLLAEHAPVTRENIQMVIAVASRATSLESPVISSSMLRAAAHQIAHNFPLDSALTRGISQILTRGEGLSVELNNAARLVSECSEVLQQVPAGTVPPDVSGSLQEVSGMLKNIAVPLGEYNTPEILAQFTGSLSGQELVSALATIENSLASYMSGNNELSLMDSLIKVLSADTSLSSAANSNNVAESVNLSTAESEVMKMMIELPDDEKLAERIKELVSRMKPENRNNILQALRAQEKSLIEENPVITRLSQAHEAVQAVADKAAAYKAENILGSQKDPVVFMAEVPFKLAGETGDGKLKFYGRKGTPKNLKSWNHRVVLDLIMSNIGPVLGDMKFLNSRLDVNIGIADSEAEKALADEIEVLKENLVQKGYNPEINLKVIEPIEEVEEPQEHRPLTLNKPVFDKGAVDEGNRRHLDLEI